MISTSRRLLLASAVFALARCSWTFDSAAPEVQLLGEAPDIAGVPRLNQAPAGNVGLMTGADGAPWAVIGETPMPAGIPGLGGAQMPDQVVRLVRLYPPAAEELVRAPRLSATGGALYLLDPGADLTAPTKLTVRGPEAGTGQQFSLPPGNKLMLTSAGDEAFLVWVIAKETTTFQIYRRDGAPVRTLPVMPGVEPDKPLDKGRLFFDAGGEVLYAQDAAGRIVAHATAAERDVDLGVLPRTAGNAPSGRLLLACDGDGLRSVPADGTPARVLDPGPCDPAIFRARDGSLYYLSGAAGQPGAEVRQVPLSGGAPPTVVLPGEAQQLLTVGPGGALCYSTDPPVRYGAGIGDGWLGGWRFMERGRATSFSADGLRLRFLEGGANSDGVGELLSAPVPGGAALHLALNVRQFAEVAPGRVLAIANAAYKGGQNRLVLIDEEARTARWVAGGARDFIRIPGTGDLLVRLVSGQAYDVVRLSIP